MNHTKNTVAQIFKTYSFVNFFACMLLLGYLRDIFWHLETEITILWFAISFVVNFVIYAIGEVVQLLDEIEQNTRKTAIAPEISHDASAELPEL